jgi:Winged helix DNA-binding domain
MSARPAATSRLLPDAGRQITAVDLRRNARWALLARVGWIITFSGTVLLDGFFQGIWQIKRQGDTVTLLIGSFAPISKHDRDALAEEGTRLLGFAAGDAVTHDVQFAPRA